MVCLQFVFFACFVGRIKFVLTRKCSTLQIKHSASRPRILYKHDGICENCFHRCRYNHFASIGLCQSADIRTSELCKAVITQLCFRPFVARTAYQRCKAGRIYLCIFLRSCCQHIYLIAGVTSTQDCPVDRRWVICVHAYVRTCVQRMGNLRTKSAYTVRIIPT